MDELQVFNGLKVKEENGRILFDAETAALGIGLTKTSKGNVYVRWERVNEYLGLSENGQLIKRGDFITEPQFYKLTMKANNDTAERFQDWVTEEVLPSIRKTGSYTQRPMTTQEQVSLALKGWQEHNERFIAVETEIEDIKDNMGLPANMAETLTIARRKQVITILGGKNAPAYKQLSKNVFAEFGRDFKQYFELPRYDSLAMRRFDEAIDYTHHWQPSINMTLLIRQLNSQTALAV
ncbi:ORF6C domain-containing protein [Periweissella fabaria]|uniref:Bro-N domain-containing protein n=1 Tax=Periweissella fabaria TaxID=546157 RepID=A0ABN8BMK6_9LACO|nr:ORF6C domain-containing protein [Periweissella fabaria]MCM0596248.1 ORF6C domain-containing protein [Periweissella fabaria]CAH0417500.1 hypothetical protein WFA24289_01842 [Periweissella fabaria]